MNAQGESDLERRLSPLAATATKINERAWAVFRPQELGYSPRAHQAEASCEVIRQTDYCLTAFLARQREKTPGERYLALYGVLQALFVQQDAVRHLYEAFKRPCGLKQDPRLSTIRQLRNSAIGHPTQQTKGVPATTSNYLVSLLSVPDKVIVIANYHDHRVRRSDWIEIGAVIEEQRGILGSALDELALHVDEVWAETNPEEYFGPGGE